MSVLNDLTGVLLEDTILNFVSRIDRDNKERIKENLDKYEQFKQMLGTDNCFLLTTLNGKPSIMVLKKSDIAGFNCEKPTIINIDDIFNTVKDGLNG